MNGFMTIYPEDFPGERKIFFAGEKPLDKPLGVCYYNKALADVAHLVERHLAKVEVASSSLVIRSKIWQECVLHSCHISKLYMVWRHSQAVRQRSAKPLFPSSILGGASNNKKTSFWMSFLFFPQKGMEKEAPYMSAAFLYSNGKNRDGSLLFSSFKR